MCDAWDHFKELQRKCPQHGYRLWLVVQTLYNGLTYSTRALVDATCRGSITSKMTKVANQLIEELAKNNYQAPFKKSVGRRQGGVLELDLVSSLEAKFEALMTKLNQQTPREPTLGEIA